MLLWLLLLKMMIMLRPLENEPSDCTTADTICKQHNDLKTDGKNPWQGLCARTFAPAASRLPDWSEGGELSTVSNPSARAEIPTQFLLVWNESFEIVLQLSLQLSEILRASEKDNIIPKMEIYNINIHTYK